MENHVKENIMTAFKGMLGVSGTGTSIYVSLLPQIEAWLRIVALIGGILVSIFTIWSILKNRKQ